MTGVEWLDQWTSHLTLHTTETQSAGQASLVSSWLIIKALMGQTQSRLDSKLGLIISH